jgi:glycerol-3-phosphate dehydrogenase
MDEEIEFILSTAGRYLERKPGRKDVLSAFAGIRPLSRPGPGGPTSALSRDHSVHVDPNRLLTITGGKWTTYRHMAHDCVDQAAVLGDLPERECVTKTLNLHGTHANSQAFGPLAAYGTDAVLIAGLSAAEPEWGRPLDPALPVVGAEVIWAAREEMARTVEDVLARRTRALVLNAEAAVRMAPQVAALLARELGRDAAWQAAQVSAFNEVAAGYRVAGPGFPLA